MGNFRNKALYLLNKFAGIIREYKFSVSLIVLFSVFEAAAVISEYNFNCSIPYEETIFRFCIFLGAGLVFSETCLKKWKQLAGILLSAILAGFFAFCIEMDKEASFFGMGGAVWRARAQRFGAGYLLLLAVLIVYFCWQKKKIKFEKYLINLFFNFMIIVFSYFILLIGVGLVSSIFDTLILKGSSNITLGCEILVTGLFGIGCIAALNITSEMPVDALKILIRYVLPIFTMCALGIVYLYVLRIIFCRELPSNEIFSILSGLFGLGMPIWIMAEYWRDETKYSRILSLLPDLFAPLILMQILAIGLRINANGLTPERYAGVMLIVFEIGTLLIWHLYKNHLESVAALLCVLIAVSIFAPVVNLDRLSVIWQSKWLQKYYEMSVNGQELTAGEYGRLKGAYSYLQGEADFDAILKQRSIDRNSLEYEMERWKDADLRQYQYIRIHGCQMVGELDVQEFETMNMVNMDDSNEIQDKNSRQGVDFSAFTFVIRETGETIVVDISDFAQNYMTYMEENPDADQEEQSKYMRSFNKIVIDQKRVLYINHFQISYKEGIDGKDYFEWGNIQNISGMLLQK